ncbi:MAG: hypothetical protein HXK00_00325 [Abiotrophia defectiva]|uniref:PD-(D/E)XK endonuclease-like domain-containing protein n=1 Tax=Abiotrophia defectiva TaxID=46125 RepID=A0A929QSA4_ABIDE|nr:hypothetical protein [Abiotrophia defectiva]
MVKFNIGNFLAKIENRQKILPHLEAAIVSNKWPESYQVEIDSSPYYGLTKPDGTKGVGGSGDGYFHPSTHPLMGHRRLWLEFHPEFCKKKLPQRRTLSGEMTLAMGTAIHAIVQEQMVMAGILKRENIEYEYVNEEHMCRGRIDAIATIPGEGDIPVEFKTQNSFSFKKQDHIKESWDIQLSMGMDNSGHDHGVLMVLESGWPYNMKEFQVPRNDAKLSEVYEKFDSVRDDLALDIMPKPCCEPGSGIMQECPFRYVCWGEDSK